MTKGSFLWQRGMVRCPWRAQGAKPWLTASFNFVGVDDRPFAASRARG